MKRREFFGQITGGAVILGTARVLPADVPAPGIMKADLRGDGYWLQCGTTYLKRGAKNVTMIARLLDGNCRPVEYFDFSKYALSLTGFVDRRPERMTMGFSTLTMMPKTGPHTPGGFAHLDYGQYRFDLPDHFCRSDDDYALVDVIAPKYADGIYRFDIRDGGTPASSLGGWRLCFSDVFPKGFL